LLDNGEVSCYMEDSFLMFRQFIVQNLYIMQVIFLFDFFKIDAKVHLGGANTHVDL